MNETVKKMQMNSIIWIHCKNKNCLLFSLCLGQIELYPHQNCNNMKWTFWFVAQFWTKSRIYTAKYISFFVVDDRNIDTWTQHRWPIKKPINAMNFGISSTRYGFKRCWLLIVFWMGKCESITSEHKGMEQL